MARAPARCSASPLGPGALMMVPPGRPISRSRLAHAVPDRRGGQLVRAEAALVRSHLTGAGFASRAPAWSKRLVCPRTTSRCQEADSRDKCATCRGKDLEERTGSGQSVIRICMSSVPGRSTFAPWTMETRVPHRVIEIDETGRFLGAARLSGPMRGKLSGEPSTLASRWRGNNQDCTICHSCRLKVSGSVESE